jgi:hypothetical protein
MPRLVATSRPTNSNVGSPTTSHSFAILSSPTSSPSLWPSALQQIVDCEVQPQVQPQLNLKRENDLHSDYLLSPMTSSPAVAKTQTHNQVNVFLMIFECETIIS